MSWGLSSFVAPIAEAGWRPPGAAHCPVDIDTTGDAAGNRHARRTKPRFFIVDDAARLARAGSPARRAACRPAFPQPEIRNHK
ncbi:hypothetical protein BURCENBC7_AP7209 [Burkholderia cenocepacia BC7]|nr:hypothetical protein BURCENK562V_C1146 [Burkholderia cenocepacia K56-2Valvano]ERI25362.1 hypothetical protein BURCENBC7_AP7209 [Burkholderia cenocepacia BC7]